MTDIVHKCTFSCTHFWLQISHLRLHDVTVFHGLLQGVPKNDPTCFC